MQVAGYKIAFIGPPDTGKTSIINRLHENQFLQGFGPTVGASFLSHDVETAHGTVALNIWDTAGQERYKSLIPMYSRNAVVLIVVYDVSAYNTFEDSKVWCERFRAKDGDETQDVYYVGNKIDLLHDKGHVETARNYADSIGAEYWNTSAKTGEGIPELFCQIAENLIKRPQKERVGGARKMAGSGQRSCRC
jgi:Ras-related protein Rab-5C